MLFAAGQSEPPLTRTSESMNVSVIEVDVIVLDASGNPVTGLTRGDFQLLVGRHKRRTTHFYAVNRTQDSVAAFGAPSGEASARRDYVVIFVDDLPLRTPEKKRALNALSAFIGERVRSGTAAMLVQSGGSLRIVQKFTEDAALLAHSIDVLEREPSHGDDSISERREILRLIDLVRADPGLKENMAEMLRQMISSFAEHEQLRTEQTMTSIDQMVHIVSGLDGRRVLVYVSDGLPMQPAAEVFQYYRPEDFYTGSSSDAAKKVMAQAQPLDAMSVNLNAKFIDLARRAALAGVQLFAVDARGVQGFDDSPADAAMTSSRLDSALIRSNLHGPLQLLADETGGRPSSTGMT